MRKITAIAGATLLAATALAGCSLDSSNSSAKADCTPAHPDLSTVTKGVLSVSAATLPPFTQVDGTKLAGAEGKILEKIAAMECLTLAAQPLDTASVISAAQNGRVDVAAGNWYCTAERANAMSLAGPAYGDQIGILSSTGAKTFSELEGKTVGTVDGYHWNAEFKAIYGAGLKIYPNATAMISDLKAARIDVAVDSYGSAKYSNAQHGDKWTVEVPEPDDRVASSVNPAQVCFPVPKGNAALAKAIKEDLETLRSDGSLANILGENGLDRSAADVQELKLIS
ncbi:polar amino acid transport system substrate-binding protein [Arthrobacter sp. V1I9]|uniref:substrate-binding periplasmic protein n=1 Tax=Arthrobacter sp. V1I9 TaxID=3042275 RepID=UPI00279223D8|nr:transporter substrate-binding domain-containing protein [Arthrobacter sp. V1I9]MDQ0867812.1 polar amino acid transport system substrate-binding protein [Arthrobacter sp. V1I9]